MDRIKFIVNGVECSVGSEVSSSVTLLDYVREQLELRGTKYMCREGGCGACILTAVTCPGGAPLAVNSCMVSITSCQDWNITTIEEVGNKRDGYSPIQTQLAANNGTQCGYCSPGWVMAMYSLLQNKKYKNLTMYEIEQSFGSNVCRCTGYRPIIETFKKFGKDAPKLADIEDLKICKKYGKKCTSSCDNDGDWCLIQKDDLDQNTITQLVLRDGKKWFRVKNLKQVFDVLKTTEDAYMLISGNTAKGAYPIDEYPPILIDISDVTELKYTKIDQNLIIGAGTTLTELLDIFQQTSKEIYFGYLCQLYDHVKLVAHIPVRNIGTIAGNLMTKYLHKSFPSDIFLLFETVGATLTIVDVKGSQETVTMKEFLQTNMTKKVLLYVSLPPLSDEYKIVTHKIMPRAQNAHAIVNAGFLYKLSKSDDYVIESRIVYGGLSPNFIRAEATEAYLKGKKLFLNETLRGALQVLSNELTVAEDPVNYSVAYRKRLSLHLFYKSFLSLCPENINLNIRYKSGGTKIHASRPLSQARQVYDTHPSLYPLNQPLEKLEALTQCSGEATYTDDLPSFPRETFAAFVLATVPLGDIESIDPSKALAQKDVIAFYSAKDIPGLNAFNSGDVTIDYVNNEELFCSGKVKFFNQPLGIIVAETQHIAEKAAKMVDVKYRNVNRPMIDVRYSVSVPNRIALYKAEDGKSKLRNVTRIFGGQQVLYGQYHFTMETLVCVTRPTDEGLEVHSATQWTDATQELMAKALKMDESRIDVYVHRLGGAFGIKISRSTQVAVACGLVALKLNRPCRFVLPLTTNTRAMGKRIGCLSNYEVGVNHSGSIQYIEQSHYENYGHMTTERINFLSINAYNNCYNKSNWNYKSYTVTTDVPKNTWCRAPGSLGAIAVAEWIMERIAYELSLDPLQVRLSNLDSEHYDLKQMVETITINSDYNKRRTLVNQFNINNRWKKRGLRFSLLKWTNEEGPRIYIVNLSVYHGDGSISIAHGGVEMGQGINTKAAQICSYLLKVPVDKIHIKSTNTISAPNADVSGGSVTSQNICVGVRKCCVELLKRLEPIRKQMDNPTWEALVAKAHESEIDLQTHGYTSSLDAKKYDLYGVALAEVEVDILTGESEILRVDLLQDVGLSVNPAVDIGQIEGAFTMGLGYWTSERLVYDVNNGDLLTNRTWDYHVPQVKDIPQDFRVYFRKNSYSNKAIFGSKVTGEPPICLSVVIPIAIREAIVSARQENGIPSNQWFQIDGPYTVEKICMAAETKLEDLKLY